jgi:hypothetical protein
MAITRLTRPARTERISSARRSSRHLPIGAVVENHRGFSDRHERNQVLKGVFGFDAQTR